VEKGEFVSFLGPSGCGKTTTLRMIAGFIEPTEGEICIGGERVNELPPYQRDTGMVFQNYALFPHMTVFDNIAFGLRYHKVPKSQVGDRVQEMLKLVRLEGRERNKPSELSGGQQQRIALARALVIKPKVLLLDEPLSNLDAKLREGLRIELRQIQRQVGITSIFVTHDQAEALALSDRIVVMNEGRIVQVGSPSDIYEGPDSVFVGKFIGQSNILKGEISSLSGNHAIVQLAGNLKIGAYNTQDFKAGDPVKVLIRSERIRATGTTVRGHLHGGIHLDSGMNILKGTLENFTYLGDNIYLYVRLENQETILAIEQTDETTSYHRNGAVYLEIRFTSCRLLAMD
jgi:spermidine/putrescine ABC transporter ATP-binding subunit